MLLLPLYLLYMPPVYIQQQNALFLENELNKNSKFLSLSPVVSHLHAIILFSLNVCIFCKANNFTS